jgi:hypothetical protein
VNHYYFNLDPAIARNFTLTATLVWNRQQNQTTINDLDLFLYDTATSNLVASSVSGVDNVEHLFVIELPAGRYDLQVFKNGGPTKRITSGETYALGFEMFAMRLNIERSPAGVIVSWPVYPAGFCLQSTDALGPSVVWSPVTIPTVVVNNRNTVSVAAGSSAQFFRLIRPQ